MIKKKSEIIKKAIEKKEKKKDDGIVTNKMKQKKKKSGKDIHERKRNEKREEMKLLIQQSEAIELEEFTTVFYFGIIDILITYGQSKKTAHFIKSFRYDPNTLSTVPAAHYGERFRQFLRTITCDIS